MNSVNRLIVVIFAVILLLLGASSAHADTILNYQISGPGSFSASFTLPQNPTPSAGNQFAFDFVGLPVDVNGTWTNLTVAFYNSFVGGGVLGSNTFDLYGQQLYSWSGSASKPTMYLGTFYTIGLASGSGLGLYTVTVTDPPPTVSKPVPEPASASLLGMGLVMLFGLHLLRRSA